MSNKSALQAALESVEMGPEAQQAIAALQASDLEQVDQLIWQRWMASGSRPGWLPPG